MVEEAILEFRLRKLDERGNYLLDEINDKDLMSEKCKKKCQYLNYVENLLILSSKVAGRVSVSEFTSLICVPVGITSSAVGININIWE